MKSFDQTARTASAPCLPRRPKAVVFDLDGTLIDSEALVGEAYFAAAAQFGLELSHEQFLSLVGQHREATDAMLLGYFGDFPLERFHATVSGHIGENAAPLKPGVAELMDELDAMEAPLALATSSSWRWVDRHFKHHGLHPRFSAIITRDDVTNGKPHPEPYLKAVAALGHTPAEVLAIEDSPAGVRSAHDAGLMTIMAPDLVQPDAETRGRALFVVGSLHDVLALVRR